MSRVFTNTIGEKAVMDTVRSHCADKEAWDDYRKKYYKAGECDIKDVLSYPLQLDFELNGTCNYRCESCTYRLDTTKNKREEITLDTFREIVQDGVTRGLRCIRFNYHNEPLLKKDIGDYIQCAKEAGVVDTYLSTNGSLMHEDMVKSLMNAGLDRIQISLDAVKKETYEKLRPGGDYNKVVNNVKNLLKIRGGDGLLPTIRVNFVKQKENVDELEEFREYWIEIGVDSIGVQNYCDWNNSESDDKNKKVCFKCRLPFHMMVIRYNGDILPCCNFASSEFVVGSIYRNSISEVWNSGEMQTLRKLHSTDYGWMECSICRKCVKGII